MTAEQIREKAVTELNRKAAGFIHALSNAGVRATRVRTAELKFMMRRHWHPLTADEFNPYLYEGTNAYDDVTSSSGMKESDYEMAEENGTMSEIISLQQKKHRSQKRCWLHLLRKIWRKRLQEFQGQFQLKK